VKVRTAVLDSEPDVPRRRLALLARRILSAEKSPLDVTIVLSDDATLRRLNREYRRIDRTTDVLSFNIPALPKIAGAGGEIYISVAQARRQARRFRQSLTAELERLVVHGVLHLLGHDHKKPQEAARMRKAEILYTGSRACL
jgi:probable rRNA maturation factor